MTASIFSGVSTTSMIIGRSVERRKSFALWKTLWAPKPETPRRTVAPASPAEYARRLYALLHQLDESGAARILVAAPPPGEAWEAVHDRLRRAAAAAETDAGGT